ncbi:MAG: TolC family protein [Bacteroidetes bacterium]|nr:TolC family protein [Bacteroidota bacterium]
MKRIIKICLIGLLLAKASGLHAQTPLTLDSVLTVIRDRNPMLKTYRLRADAMNAYAKGADGWMAPEVGGGLWMLPYRTVSDPRDQGQIMLSVQQKITSHSRRKANQAYMESRAGIEEASGGWVYNELKSQARAAYYQWLVLKKKKKVLVRNEAILTMMMKINQLRYPYNQSKLSDIYKVEGKLGELKNMILVNDNQAEQQNILLNQLMNLSQETRFTIDTTLSITSFRPAPVDSSTLVQNRSDIHRIDKTILSVMYNQEVEKRQSRPDINLSFNHMFARGEGMPNQFMLLGMVSIPIAPWSSKMYKANVEGMGREIESMKAERTAILNEAQGMTARLYSELNVIQRQMENYDKRILPALRKNYEAVMLAYEENREQLPMVLDAWETLSMTELQYLDTLQKYYETMVDYEKQIEL